jgi:LuxR family maltose regulon positive regulatory protein
MSENVGRYNILEEIGQGAFAIVHKGLDTALNREVALKELRPVLLQDAGWVKHFQHEARTIAQLDHPQIVPIYDIVHSGPHLFIVMKLVSGPSLDRFIATQGRLSWRQTVDMVTRMAEALDYAHSHNVLHRDLKPANILIDPERGPMLSDFGLARLTSEHSLSITMGSIVGTPNYIAPEIWEGDNATVQSDIYALSCIIFEMLTGAKLFQGQTPLAVMKAHFSPVDFSQMQWPPGTPESINQILSSALKRVPNHRFTSATAFAEALNQGGPRPSPSHLRKHETGPLLTTKLFASVNRANLVTRPRLIHLMTDAINFGQKMTLVAAPAGFGKSTLVSHWLNLRPHSATLAEQKNQPSEGGEHTRPRPAWFSLDTDDNDPVRFFEYLIAALKTAGIFLDQSVLQGPSLPPAEALATYIINELIGFSQQFVLILDDYHLISAPYIHALIEFILEHQPPQMHLILITREDPPLPLAKLRARGEIVEIRQDDLRFTAEETAQFLNQSMGLNLNADAINALENRTEGWVAGLQLAALSLQGRDEPHVADFIEAFSGSHRYVIDYLVEEVLNQQPKNIRRFLQQTAILDRLSASLCNAVTGHLDSQLILSYLDQVNLFLIPLDDRRKWYRYHHLFAEFLQTELSLNQQQELHQRAAQWFKSQDLLPEAIKHALAAQNTSLATELIIRAADSTLRTGAFVTLDSWLNTLPDDVITQHCELAIYAGWVKWIIGQVDQAAIYATAAESALSADTPTTIRGKLISLQACLSISQESHGLDLARQALPMLEETDTFFTGMALLVLGEAQNLMGDTVGAVETLSKALRIGQKHNDYFMIIGALVNLAQQLNWLGKRREAEALCYQAVRQSHDENGQLLPMAGFSYITLAEIELYTGDLERTYAHLMKGMELTRKYAMIGFTISGKLVLAPLQYAMGEPKAALATIQEVLQAVRNGNFESYVDVSTALEADFQLKQGNVNAVEQWAARVRLPAQDEPLSLMREIELQTYVKYLISVGRPAQAETLLTRLEASVKLSGRNLVRLTNLLLQALVYNQLNQPQKMKTSLLQALRLAEPEDYREVFIQAGPDLIALLPEVQYQAPHFVDTVLGMAANRFGTQQPPVSDSFKTPVSSPSIEQLLVEPLSDRELEVLRLIAAGHSNKEAADSLIVTVGTIKKHLSNIFGKLAVNSRTQAVARARDLELI